MKLVMVVVWRVSIASDKAIADSEVIAGYGLTQCARIVLSDVDFSYGSTRCGVNP